MINCYKILEVPNFSDETIVRKSYLKLAKRHHPDVSIEKDGERFKIISKAYDTLSNDATKRYHDQKLRYYLQPPTTTYNTSTQTQRTHRQSQTRPTPSPQDYKKRKERAAKVRLRSDMLFYQKQQNQLPYEIRITGWAAIALLGWQQVYQHWFVDEESYDHILGFIGVILFILSSIMLYSNTYKMLRFKTYSGKRKYNYKKQSFKIWMIVLLIGVISMPIVNNYRKTYHLENYGALIRLEYMPVAYSDDQIFVIFDPYNSGKPIITKVSFGPNSDIDKEKQRVLVKYSVSDPRIMVVMDK